MGIAERVAARFIKANELWYHLTDRAKFKLDPKFTPADNSVAIIDRSGRPGIYLGQSVERWVNGYGYWRPFVVEIKVDPSVKNDPGTHGRYGGEMFVPASSFDKLTVQRVIPLDAWVRENYGEPGWIEGALGVEFDTGQPIPQPGHQGFAEALKKYRGYRYPGPDVRSMPGGEVARLRKDLRRVKHASLVVRVAARFVALEMEALTPHQKGWEHRKEKNERVIRELEPHLQHLWRKMQYQFKGTPEERAEQFKEYVDEHPGEEMGALQDDVDKQLNRMIREFEKRPEPGYSDDVPFS